ncbi:phenylalanine--tRNA ligase subunit beta [Deltaproteobacteria bacterium PRO3]|nr:phenylalanine--tRNA ligase subunit beta [Deltaproteobacteria bacterium PRO3]
MKASVNWIKEFVKVEADAQTVADRLTRAGLEIEGLHAQGKGLEKVVTATLLKVDKHPQADRLTLCEVRTGAQVHQIVCGAKNHKAGDKVALALPGARLPNGMEIQETVIRKVKSGGMLCSEKELGFAAESEGILILPPETPEGVPLAEALGLDDTILEVNVTPNRGDCLSMRGLAREVAAAFDAPVGAGPPLSGDKREGPLQQGFSLEENIRVQLQAPDLCPRYTCRLVRGVKVGPSPRWAQRRLEACGIRAINNVVDATNYVMLETGQPLHAFDLRQIRQGRLEIRRAQAGESIVTLDGKPRPLQEGDLVIADAERILALAGVMGGADSGVEPDTQELLLESAYFAPDAVRRTAKRVGLQTESSYRFERGVDPNGCLEALNRLAALIQEWAGGAASSDVVDMYPQPVLPREIPLRRQTLSRTLGYEIPAETIRRSFRALGLEEKSATEEAATYAVPSYRGDLSREIDLVEEAARLYGYDRVPTKYPRISLHELPPPREHPFDRIRRALVGWGFSEVLHYSFTSPQLLRRFGFEAPEAMTLLNPISEELAVMRPSLLPQMVQTLQSNVHRGNKDLKLFELRPVYLPKPETSPPFAERWRLCLGLSGSRRGLHFLEKEEGVSFLDLKGYLKALFGLAGPGVLLEGACAQGFLHPKRQATLRWAPAGAAEREEGLLGELNPVLGEELGLRVPVALAEISLDLFLTESKNPVKFQEVSPFPSIWRDLNLIVDESVSHGEILGQIRAHGGPWVRQAVFFDLYRGKPLEEGKKAMTFTLEYGSPERTLTDDEVNQARERLLENLKEKIGVSLR